MDKNTIKGAPERRLITAPFEWRAAGEGSNLLTLRGYASVFDVGYDLMGGPPFGWTETVDAKAFDETLKQSPDLHLLINHEGMPLARTRSGTLVLATDTHGLQVEAKLDRRDPDVARLEVKMERGDMDEMSFAFRTRRDEWNDEQTERRLLEVDIHKGDVSVVNFGANPATQAELNSLLRGLEQGDERILAEVRQARAAGVDISKVKAALTRAAGDTPSRAGRMTRAEAAKILAS
jgi:HK97 family phage prohead protease